MKPALVRCLAVIAASAVCLALAGCGTVARVHHRTSAVQIGGKFAGYLWYGPVTAVSGDWTMPRIRAKSRAGHASTWVGAEAPGGSDGPFIQIGTTEDRPIDPGQGKPHDRYEAFWSDQAHGFHPLKLFLVAPGDRISASMRLRGSSWKLTIDDATSGATRSFTTAQEGHSRFNLAEWLQEDVTNAANNRPFPYPSLSATQMRGITVNLHTPPASQLQSQWIAASGKYFGPTPVTAGAFAIHAVDPGSAAGRYLLITADQNDTVSRVASDLVPGSGASRGAISADAQAVTRSMLQTADRLQAARWPGNLHTLVAQLARETRYVARRLRKMHDPSARAVLQTLTAQTPYGNEHATAEAIHRRLGIPFSD